MTDALYRNLVVKGTKYDWRIGAYGGKVFMGLPDEHGWNTYRVPNAEEKAIVDSNNIRQRRQRLLINHSVDAKGQDQ